MDLFGPSAVASVVPARAHAQTQTQGAGSSSSSANTPGSLTSEQTFLQLLIAQIQNQDPLNPTDSIQFVGQLVQYSELEQLMGINQGVQSLVGTTTSNQSANAVQHAKPATSR